MSPVVFGGARGNAKHVRCFFNCHANKVTKFNKFRFYVVSNGQPVQRFTHGKELIVTVWRYQVHFLNFHTYLATAMTEGLFATGSFNENAPHGFGGGREEVGAVLKLCLSVVADETEPGFVDEIGGLQRLTCGFVGHSMRGEAAQFSVNERQ